MPKLCGIIKLENDMFRRARTPALIKFAFVKRKMTVEGRCFQLQGSEMSIVYGVPSESLSANGLLRMLVLIWKVLGRSMGKIKSLT